MAKGRKRSNKEIEKPKQQKIAPAAPASFEKSLSDTGASSKKKG